MISHLRGTVAHRDAGAVVVDVGGVGYLVHVTPADHIPARGEEVVLHTSLQVREDSMTLYGSTDRASLQLFELLLTASGVGPKLALAYLSTHRPDVLRAAIAGGDLTTLTQVPGVGKKGAERLVLELKDKVGGTGAALVEVDGGVPGPAADALEEVRDALLSLGYSTAEVQPVLVGLVGVPDDVPGLLRRALRTIGTGAA
ncbi:Holliday junction branch migration protein RuvA [Nitriliruptor alkaliphilus]|uniref:Holliday junction branch migration protein RuvA n=1 Tax=Nitriliruptor alkaliphilus TaxID=427918 RepID=UPI000698D2C0|nr:Holliday junction branch migration protein RuvA [Nitriliruptor alkaliphilus]